MRMDHYMVVGKNKVHWLQIFLATAVIVVAALIICKILDTTLSKDFKNLELAVLKKNEGRAAAAKGEDSDESTGLRSKVAKQVDREDVYWKRLQGDVMRAPDYPAVFSVLIGIGF